jgi:hypothetical protein
MQTQIALERVRMEKISEGRSDPQIIRPGSVPFINHEQDLSYFSQQLKPAQR